MQPQNVKKIISYYGEIPKMIKSLKLEKAELEDKYNLLRNAMGGTSKNSAPANLIETFVCLDDGDLGNKIQEVTVKIQVLYMDSMTIKNCLDSVRSTYKQIISMRCLRDYSWTRISAELNIPNSTARRRYNKVMERLGEALDEAPMIQELLKRASHARI